MDQEIITTVDSLTTRKEGTGETTPEKTIS